VFSKIWPDLTLISCWSDSEIDYPLHTLRNKFPNVTIQPKGLIATEGIVSFPLMNRTGGILSCNSHFFEFKAISDNNTVSETRLAYELEKGKRYSVIITTGGGLYRYNLKDIIEVIDIEGVCPFIRFTGKEDNVSDICGEKLNEAHVRSIVKDTLAKYSLYPSFFMLAPEHENGYFYYTLFVEFIHNSAREHYVATADDFLYDIERKLNNNFHYKYCCNLGQLRNIRTYIIRDNALDTYLKWCSRDKVLGNIKNVALSSYCGWSKIFNGQFLQGGEK
jgi:hypothetical protein